MARSGKFFAEGLKNEELAEFGLERAEAQSFDAPRGMTAATAVLDLSNRRQRNTIRSATTAQHAASGYAEQIGEVKYAFNFLANITSRAILYPAIIGDEGQIPMEAKSYLAKLREQGGENPEKLEEAVNIAHDLMRELRARDQFIRRMVLNFSITGECYLASLPKWSIYSIDEILPGNPPRRRTRRDGANIITLPKTTYIARMWRAHHRFGGEADSTMLGVLDLAEKLVLYDQLVRSVIRSGLGAGIVTLPQGTQALGGQSLEDAVRKITVEPVNDEAANGTVDPLLLLLPTGANLEKMIQRIELARKLDPALAEDADKTLSRLLTSIDIPKDLVTGFSDVRYANGVAIDDSLYKAHCEPMLMLCSDSLSEAYLIPRMRKCGVDPDIIDRFCVWYNPSEIVTRPDESGAADTGYDSNLISAKAWRRARGFTEDDAPKPEEILRKAALGGRLQPDMASVVIESMDPKFFADQRTKGQESAGIPDEVRKLLTPGGDTEAEPEPPQTAPESIPNMDTSAGQTPAAEANSGGNGVTPNGARPPALRQDRERT